MLPEVAFIASGTNRTKSVLRNNSAEASDTTPIFDHVEPLLIEYCHVPLPLLSDVMAMPSTAPLSTSVIRSPLAEAMMEATVWPPWPVWSSVMVVSVIVPVLSSTGASFIATICTVVVAVKPLTNASLATKSMVRSVVVGSSDVLL